MLAYMTYVGLYNKSIFQVAYRNLYAIEDGTKVISMALRTKENLRGQGIYFSSKKYVEKAVHEKYPNLQSMLTTEVTKHFPYEDDYIIKEVSSTFVYCFVSLIKSS